MRPLSLADAWLARLPFGYGHDPDGAGAGAPASASRCATVASMATRRTATPILWPRAGEPSNLSCSWNGHAWPAVMMGASYSAVTIL